ncbi:MAG TPA: MBL fold metallo-hydrolase [Bacteroidales bacterium]|nr:MBL fold metallo-hydrolase [Bacteroidales bacterium]
MNFKIHRGTQEIGGSCVEIWTDTTKILLDFGMPLVERDGSEFDFDKYKNLSPDELIKAGVLPDVQGIYNDDKILIDALLISHAHQDHWGLYNYINPKIKCYLGRATKKLIEINNLFTPKNTIIGNPVYFEKELAFQIGNITITAYWADHSAFDSYSFLIEANGKSIFYSGDFRGHGRKSKVFRWFTHNAPQNVDYLLLEGTSLGRNSKPFKTETNIEDELVALFNIKGKSNVVYTSGQNIDRIVSIYNACLRTDKTLVVDVYVASILKELSEFAKIPYPSDDFKSLSVIFPYYTSKRLAKEGNKKILYQFKNFKISKKEISSQPDKYVMIIRPSMQKDLERITGLDGGNLVYSMWEGYLKKPDTKKFMEYFGNRKFTIHNIHTSGHADIDTLKQMVEAIKPKSIVPIHTFNAGDYSKIFNCPITLLKDGEII